MRSRFFKKMVRSHQKSISVAPKINFCPTNFGCGLCACWRGAAMPKLLADTLRMFALLGCIPSCVRRRARSDTGVYALARAPARKRARARMHMHTLAYRCKICKTGMFTKEWICTVRVRGSGPKSAPFPDTRNGVKFFRKKQFRQKSGKKSNHDFEKK